LAVNRAGKQGVKNGGREGGNQKSREKVFTRFHIISISFILKFSTKLKESDYLQNLIFG
jgi:hypothetical protein